MDYYIQNVLSRNLWFSTTANDVYYTICKNKIWIVSDSQLLDVFSNTIYAINKPKIVSVLFRKLLYKLFCSGLRTDDAISTLLPLDLLDEVIFGKSPLKRLNTFTSLTRYVDYRNVVESSMERMIDRKTGHFLHSFPGGSAQLILGWDAGIPRCDHRLLKLDCIVKTNHSTTLKMQFNEIDCCCDGDDNGRNTAISSKFSCIKCEVLKHLWKYCFHSGNHIILSVELSSLLLCY